MYKVRNLRQMQAKVYESGSMCAFVSYNTLCAVYDRSTKTLHVGKCYSYSPTTSRQFRAFVEDFMGMGFGTPQVREALARDDGYIYGCVTCAELPDDLGAYNRAHHDVNVVFDRLAA